MIANNGKPAILLVDDHDGMRQAAAAIFRGAGYTVYEAGDGQAGLELFKQHHAHIGMVLTDTMMPVMGGEAMTREIKAQCPDMPVMALTGWGDHGLDDELFCGAVAKPYAEPRNLEVVQAMLRTPALGYVGV